MVNIIHRVGIKAPLEPVYAALSTVEGIASWWTRDTTGTSELGNTIHVRFCTIDGREQGSMDMAVVALDPNQRVHWRFTAGPAEWLDTEVVFELKQEGDFTIVHFSHLYWREAVEFTAHCSMKWGVFMLSLKDLVENGTGKPSPLDIKIDNWN